VWAGLPCRYIDKWVLIVGATNRPWAVDPAILRRLPKQIQVRARQGTAERGRGRDAAAVDDDDDGGGGGGGGGVVVVVVVVMMIEHSFYSLRAIDPFRICSLVFLNVVLVHDLPVTAGNAQHALKALHFGGHPSGRECGTGRRP
jgi:hypothetical protein